MSDEQPTTHLNPDPALSDYLQDPNTWTIVANSSYSNAATPWAKIGQDLDDWIQQLQSEINRDIAHAVSHPSPEYSHLTDSMLTNHPIFPDYSTD